ncbi:hypothetical protein Lsed01_02322 [Demequina sediminis]|jgi:uncharacterized protein (DUF1778 family)|uniref:DUF1778 domain-containing protein n=1 Tax=Demequina sediminis TaxID=1930058 RepID=A0ABP9WJ47_9MICO|nr:DUF1778 domain-containing protein [Demequina sediminis]BDZ60635.1 hypothetical protein GCM10025873_04260 [Demequina sediminis]
MSAIARDAHLQVRISTTEKERLRRAAEQSGLDLSSFVLQHARRAADEILAEQAAFTLTDVEYDRFLEQLDAPAQVVPGLANLMRRASPFSDR